MPHSALTTPYPQELTFYIRADSVPAKSGSQTPSPPALSPSAIVGLAIIGAVFLTVLFAAVLRLCYSPNPQDANPSSVYRPDDSNVTQLARMKQVREFNRAAAWERAKTCEIESEMEERTSSMSGKRASRSLGGRSPGKGAKKRRVPRRDPVPDHRGSADWAVIGRVEQGERRGRAWRARMGMSAMEVSGQVEMLERLDLGAGQGGYGHEVGTVLRESVLLPPPMSRGARQPVEYEEDYSCRFTSKAVDDGADAGKDGREGVQDDERVDAGDGRRHTVPLIAGARAGESRAGMAL